MATQNLPQVVLFPQPTTVNQAQLAHIVWLRQQVEQTKAKLEQAEAALRATLDAGAPVEPGLLRAFLKTIERRSVAWKAVVERELGEDYAKRVLAATKPETFTHLVVEA